MSDNGIINERMFLMALPGRQRTESKPAHNIPGIYNHEYKNNMEQIPKPAKACCNEAKARIKSPKSKAEAQRRAKKVKIRGVSVYD